LKDRLALATESGNDGKAKAHDEESSSENRRSAGQDIGGAAAAEKPAGLSDAEAAALRALQQHHPDHGDNDHEVDNNENDHGPFHTTKPASRRRTAAASYRTRAAKVESGLARRSNEIAISAVVADPGDGPELRPWKPVLNYRSGPWYGAIERWQGRAGVYTIRDGLSTLGAWANA
jgi:hypothetical protein